MAWLLLGLVMTPLCGSWNGMRVVKMVFYLAFFMTPTTLSAGKTSIPPQKQKAQELLKRLNKPAVKSIQSPDGDIIDCVPIHQQPAFDHPLLKNHTIQIAPSFYPKGHSFDETKTSSNVKPIVQLWHLNGRCPEETIPVRRTKEEDILRASFVKSYKRKEDPSLRKANYVEAATEDGAYPEHAAAVSFQGKYYGAKASFNLWKPKVEPNQSSAAQMWVSASPDAIEAGWHVNRILYPGEEPRLFTYWTSDDYNTTGCYNLACPGFVQTSNGIALGAALSPVSIYGGTQYDITLLVWKNSTDGNWWLVYGNNSTVGYWPASLFSGMSQSASLIRWGGEVATGGPSTPHTTTQMGSGHSPSEGPGKASFIRNILHIDDEARQLVPPKDIGLYATKPSCYDADQGKSESFGTYIYYGGPGRSPQCP